MARQTTDYSRAAAAVVNNMDLIYAADQRNKMDPGMIAMEIDNANAERYKAYIRTASDVIDNDYKNDSEIRKYEATEKVAEEKKKIEAPAKFAGKLAALGKTGLGMYAIKTKQDADRKAELASEQRLEEMYAKWDAYRDRPKEPETIDDETKEIYDRLGVDYDESGNILGWKKDRGVETAVAPSETGVTLEKTGPSTQTVLKPLDGKGAFSMDLTQLSDQDWKELGYVVSGEAQRGTDDEFGVAASVLNRVKSGQYPNTIGEVARQPGQYHAVKIGNARYDDALTAKLRSPEGIQKLQSALEVLEGRTDFKGQALLHNRVAAEDPMFSSGGNYFHFNWQ